MEKSPKFLLKFSEKQLMSSKNQDLYKFKKFQLDVAERQLLKEDALVSLTPKVFDVLAVLVERGGHLVEKEEILRLVWEDSFVEEANVARIIHSLRKTLGENTENKFIETVPKKGYRFVAEVEKTDGGQTPPKNGKYSEEYTPSREDCINYVLETGEDFVKVEDFVNAPKTENFYEDFAEDVEINNSLPKNSENRYLIFLALAVILFAGVAAAAIWMKNNSQSSGNGANFAGNAIENSQKSIAVLPLKPINNENRDSIYELGIAESLILKLSAANDLVVRPLSATRKYIELEQNPTEAGREQQVDFVLSSNYQISDGKIRVTSQLINVQSGKTEEVFKSEKDSSDVFSMQDAIAGDIGNVLLTRLGKRENILTAKRGTSNEEAYRLYLQAAYIFDQWNKTEIPRAIEFLEKAVRLDPNYVEAHTMLAYAYKDFAGKNGKLSPQEQYDQANKSVSKALELNPHFADAHAVLGLLKSGFEGNFAEAENEFKEAIELNPDSQMAHALYANFLLSSGRFEEAKVENSKAIKIEPAASSHQITYGMILYHSRRYKEATAHFERLIEKDANFVYPYFWMWLLYDLQNDEARAFEWFLKYQTQIKSTPETIKTFQNIFEKSGWKGILREIISRDEETLKSSRYQGLNYEIACFSARLGDKEKALDYLEKTYEHRISTVMYAKIDPYLQSLHGEPRFEALVKKIGANQ